MIAYKFLREGSVALFTGHRWPVPTGDDPGAWVEAAQPIALCGNGIHACSADDLAAWIDDELWLIELAGDVETHDEVAVAARGRLLRRVDQWAPATAREFAEDCVGRARDRATAALELAGRAAEARELAAAATLDEAQGRALELAAGDTGAGAITIGLFADTVELLGGRRPVGGSPGAQGTIGTVSEAAIAANLGFVVAHFFGMAASESSGDASTYDAAFATERARQNAWLRDRLALDPVSAGRADSAHR